MVRARLMATSGDKRRAPRARSLLALGFAGTVWAGLLLALGAVLANFIGTTGASMLLIRPYLRINKYRVAPYHVVFFIPL